MLVSKIISTNVLNITNIIIQDVYLPILKIISTSKTAKFHFTDCIVSRQKRRVI